MYPRMFCYVLPMTTVDGKNGRMSFDGSVVVIESRSNLGNNPMGRRVVQLADVESVDLVEPHGAYLGTFNVVLKGAPSRLGRSVAGRLNAVNSDTGMTFKPRQLKAVRGLAGEIESARAALPPAGVRGEVAAQLRNLGSMHHRGAIDDATFIREMHTLLPQL